MLTVEPNTDITRGGQLKQTAKNTGEYGFSQRL